MSDTRPNQAPASSRSGVGPHILLAEDDKELRAMLVLLLSEHHYQVSAVSTGRELLDRAAEELASADGVYDVIVSDIRMPGLSAFDVLNQARELTARLPVVLLTAFADQATHRRAERLGVAAVLDKPFDIDDLRSALGELLSKPWRGAARQCAVLGSSGGPSGSADTAEPSVFP